MSEQNEMMKNGYMSVRNVLTGRTFLIPKYQRGYRWQGKHVEAFVEDIYESRLCDNPIADKYCIQPLVVGKRMTKDDKAVYDVIDGQQRLTTIYILLKVLNDLGSGLDMQGVRLPEITYQERGDNLANIKDSNAEETIELLYMNNAYDKIRKKIEQKMADMMQEEVSGAEEKKKELIRRMREIVLDEVQFIWHEINIIAQDANDEEQKLFDTINSGKIALTNAELIKAVFMNPTYYGEANDSKTIKDRQILISELWDIMENQLHNPYFWLFIPHAEQYSEKSNVYADTRIDILFEYLLYRKKKQGNSLGDMKKKLDRKDSKDDEYYVYEEIKEWIENEIKDKKGETSRDVMERIWDEVCDVFYGLKELYEDNPLFNLASLYVFFANRKKGTSDTMKESKVKSPSLEVYHELFEVLELPRNRRKSKLKKRIVENLFGFEIKIKKSRRRFKGIDKTLKNIKCTSIERPIIRRGILYRSYRLKMDKSIKKMRKERQTDRMVDVLLAYNIAILNRNKVKKNVERYNFRSHRRKNWEKEHIFAVHEDFLTGNTRDEKANVDKARKVLAELFATNGLNGNEYCKYINYLYSKDEGNLPGALANDEAIVREEKAQEQAKIDKKYYEQKYSLEDFDERKVQKFIADNSSQERKYTYQVDFARTVRLWREMKKILAYYESIEFAEDVVNETDSTIKQGKIKEYLTGHDISLKESEGLLIMNTDSVIESALSRLLPNAEEIDLFGLSYSLPQNFWDNYSQDVPVKEFLKEEMSEGETKLEYLKQYFWEKFQSSVRSNLYEDYDAKELNGKLPSGFDYDAIVECSKTTMRQAIEEFFKNASGEGSYASLLRDDSFGNITLLPKRINGSFSNESFASKRKMLFAELDNGSFLPPSTISIFSGRFNVLESSTNQWLIMERRNYLEDIIRTLNKYYFD